MFCHSKNFTNSKLVTVHLSLRVSPEDLDIVCKWRASVCDVCKDVKILLFALIPENATLFNLLCGNFIK